MEIVVDAGVCECVESRDGAFKIDQKVLCEFSIAGLVAIAAESFCDVVA